MTNNNDLVDAIIAISELRATNRALLAQLDEARRERDDKQKAIVTIVTGLEMTSKQLEQARRERAEAEEDIERSRRTIRALVVAARAMWDVVKIYEGDTEDDQLRRDIRAVTVDFIKSAERSQAWKK